MLKHLIAASLFFSQLTAAAAAGLSGSATVEWDREARPKVVLEDVVWSCASNGCRGALNSAGTNAFGRYCKILARYGKVTSFRTTAGPFGEDELVRCNKHRRD